MAPEAPAMVFPIMAGQALWEEGASKVVTVREIEGLELEEDVVLVEDW